MSDLLTISSGALTAQINPLGAELWSLADRQGREYMTDADPAFWAGHAPLLFPVVGSLTEDKLRLDGEEYPLARHGFARRSRFAVTEQGESFVRFRLTDSAETRAVYPFVFALDMAFCLDGSTLAMEAKVFNPGDAPLPFSFGYHPAFAWPLPGGAEKSAHKLVFAEPEPQDVRRVGKADGLLQPEGEPTPVQGRELALSESLFTADALIWTDLASRALSYGADGGAWLDIAFPDTPMLGLWQVPGARYICIEPWAGHADPAGFAGDFRDKPGVMELGAGQRRCFRIDVTVREDASCIY
ncbi:aldose 1-epimerase family protein [Novosphingobium sp. Chol11]|uniref:aldose 1-epimerase family protein n=1 Tax=Novosphingobium sp. Chol11 TaxID=1385763 RepID=UPI0025DBE943|nr:aldose 1-epimerase family protein [Novosphingobium sp. Chol11]